MSIRLLFLLVLASGVQLEVTSDADQRRVASGRSTLLAWAGLDPPEAVVEAIMAGELEEAVAILEDAVRMKPPNMLTMVQLGTLQYQLNNYELAVDMFLQAKDLAPKHPLPLVRLAMILPAPGQDDSIDLLKKALKLCRKKKKYSAVAQQARSYLIHQYLVTGRLTQAEKIGAKLLAKNRTSAEDLINLAGVLRHSGKLQDSAILLDRAVGECIDALEPDGRLQWPYHFTDEEQERQAAVHSLHSAARDLCSALHASQQYEAALSTCERLLSSDPNSAVTHTIYALALESHAERFVSSGGADQVEVQAEMAQQMLQEAERHFVQGCEIGDAEAGGNRHGGDGDVQDPEKVLMTTARLEYPRLFHRLGRAGAVKSLQNDKNQNDQEEAAAGGGRAEVIRGINGGGWSGAIADQAVSGSSSCYIDQRDWRTLSVEEFHSRYADASRPVLLYGEGLLDAATSQRWGKEQLLRKYGDQVVRVSSSSTHVPEQVMPGRKFNRTEKEAMTLREFVTNRMGALRKGGGGEHSETGGEGGGVGAEDPPYVFRRLQLGDLSADVRSANVEQYFADLRRFSWRQEKREEKFIFSVGPTHSGLFFHQHSSAWNALVHGQKRWFMLPAFSYYGAEYQPTLRWLKSDAYRTMQKAEGNASKAPLECTQRPGEVLFVPQGWHHAVVSLSETVSCAVEVGYSTRSCQSGQSP
jgi:tetratricopeptide (TPR) repeat protein